MGPDFAGGPELRTRSQLAFWLAPDEESGNYHFRLWVVVGTLENVRQSLIALVKEKS